MKQSLIRLYAAFLSTVFGIVFTAQILGFIGLYTAFIAIPITLVTIILAYIAYQQFGKTWFETLHPQEPKSPILANTIIVTCLTIVGIIFVQRMILWHQSTLGAFVSVDFVGYHSIKVYELFNSGSAWNLAIPYGQYPLGYESLITFAMFFIPDIRIAGIIHAVIFVLFWLTIALLIIRYTKLSIDLSLLIALSVCFMPIIFPQVLNMGKNDLLLSVTVLMAILHAPIGDEHFHPIGLAFATMLSLATKATGLYILFYLWALVMLNWGQHFRNQTWRDYMQPRTFILVIALMFPGGLWVIRNYLVLGGLFTSEIESFFQTSIFANFENPTLYDRGYSLGIALAIVLGLSVISLFYKKLGWQMAGLLIVIVLTFGITPLSAFLTVNNLDYLDVQWRFVLHGIVMMLLIVITLLAPLIRPIYDAVSQYKSLVRFACFGLIIVSIGLIAFIGVDDIFGRNPNQWEGFIDPTLQENSIYDEIAQLETGTIYIENINWLAVLLNNPNLTVTELRYPLGAADVYPMPSVDYIAFLAGARDEPLPILFNAFNWEIIFEDDTGRIYHRVP